MAFSCSIHEINSEGSDRCDVIFQRLWSRSFACVCFVFLCFWSLICSLCLRRGLRWLYGLDRSRKVVPCLLRISLLKSLGCLVARDTWTPPTAPIWWGPCIALPFKTTPSLRSLYRLSRISFSSPWPRLVRNPKNQVLPQCTFFFRLPTFGSLKKN